MVSASLGGAVMAAMRSSFGKKGEQAGRDDSAVSDRNDAVAAAAVKADRHGLAGPMRSEDGAAARARRDGDDRIDGSVDLQVREGGDDLLALELQIAHRRCAAGNSRRTLP